MVVAFLRPNPSFIGVIIACSGNVLISLALNCQRLAHVRLESGEKNPNGSKANSGEPQAGAYRDDDQEPPSSAREGCSLIDLSQDVRVAVLIPPDDDDANPWSGPSGSRGHGSRTDIPNPIVAIQPPTPIPDRRANRASSSGIKSGSSTTLAEDDEGADRDTWDPYPVAIATPGRHSRNPKASRKSGEAGSPDNERDEDGDQHSRSQDSVDEEQRPQQSYLSSKLWWLGITLMALGETGNFLSYGFAPASVVAPLGTVALVANCFFAPLILKERFNARDLFGVFLSILGAVTVVLSAKSSNPTLSPDSLVAAFKQSPFLGYLATTSVTASALLLLTHSKRFGQRWVAVDVGICALFGGYTVLATKALSSLLSSLFVSAFRFPVTWVLILVVAVTSVLQVRYLNRALAVFESKKVIPTQFVFFTISAIVGSAVLYQEFRDMTASRMANFLFGVATTFLGVFILTAKVSVDTSDDGEDESKESEVDTEAQQPRAKASPASRLVPLPENSTLIPIRKSSQSTSYGAIPAVPGGGVRKRASTVSLTARPGLASGGLLLVGRSPQSPGILEFIPTFTEFGKRTTATGLARIRSRNSQHGRAHSADTTQRVSSDEV